jgi:hypothetical protein
VAYEHELTIEQNQSTSRNKSLGISLSSFLTYSQIKYLFNLFHQKSADVERFGRAIGAKSDWFFVEDAFCNAKSLTRYRCLHGNKNWKEDYNIHAM